MREVIHRINTPLIARVLMRDVTNPVQRWIAQIDIRRTHVDPGAQHMRTIGKLPGAHALEQVAVFLHAAIPMRAVFATLGQRAAIAANILGAEAIDVCSTRFYQFAC